ncbi:hypothetical protein QLQ09_02105 [Brucella sp. NM4]|uniref:hypothetical protein n=1 Tax=Brucella/Ochrobactrum group TaxID=2826938 RepID=UPI0024BC9F46|nr:hypothetical protein [Brucella sp. NM4]WHS30392.1 hypothetical protein QLQ09_02105 [Brucella sp. NM4]WHT45265.1 hypothetical protein QLQ11_19950 [Ochrobactrum sp. SSR]
MVTVLPIAGFAAISGEAGNTGVRYVVFGNVAPVNVRPARRHEAIPSTSEAPGGGGRVLPREE